MTNHNDQFPPVIADCTTVLVFGGTFDPPHLAHVQLPILVKRAVGADAVLYVPTATSPFKRTAATASDDHRLAMLRIALVDVDDACISTYEIDHGGVSYTVDTLAALRDAYDNRVGLRLLIGADQLLLFHQWRDWRRIIDLADPLVMVRPPDAADSLLARLPTELTCCDWAARLADVPVMDLSASEIRQRIAAGASINGMVAPQVREYIENNDLYRSKRLRS